MRCTICHNPAGIHDRYCPNASVAVDTLLTSYRIGGAL